MSHPKQESLDASSGMTTTVRHARSVARVPLAPSRKKIARPQPATTSNRNGENAGQRGSSDRSRSRLRRSPNKLRRHLKKDTSDRRDRKGVSSRSALNVRRNPSVRKDQRDLNAKRGQRVRRGLRDMNGRRVLLSVKRELRGRSDRRVLRRRESRDLSAKRIQRRNRELKARSDRSSSSPKGRSQGRPLSRRVLLRRNVKKGMSVRRVQRDLKMMSHENAGNADWPSTGVKSKAATLVKMKRRCSPKGHETALNLLSLVRLVSCYFVDRACAVGQARALRFKSNLEAYTD